MFKETIICILIIVAIFTLDFITQKYTETNIDNISAKLEKLQKSIRENNDDEIQKNIEDINNNWNEIEEKFSYYLEHDELEKVDTELKGLTSYIETKEKSMSLSELEKTIFILKHIKEKNNFSLINVF